jgi:hypothetical protein
MTHIVLLLYYIVFLSEFITAIVDNYSGFTISITSTTCYIALQTAQIIFLQETERVKLILTAKTPGEFILKNNQAIKLAKFLYIIQFISWLLSFSRITFVYKFPHLYSEHRNILIIITSIDITITSIVQVFILTVFFVHYSFFTNQHVKLGGH